MNSRNFAVVACIFGALHLNALTLSEAYKQALAHEPRLKAARYQSEAGKEAVEQMKAKLYPQIQANLSWGRYEYEYHSSTRPVKENYTDYSVSAVQPVYHPEYWTGIDQSETKQLMSEYQYKNQAQQMGLDLAKVYFMALRSEKQIELLESQKKYYERKYQQLSEMLAMGLSNKIDLFDKKIALDKVVSEWNAEKKRFHVAKLRIEHMTGTALKRHPSFELSGIDGRFLMLDHQQLESRLNLNPAIKTAEMNLKSAEYEVQIRSYEHHPKVDMSLTRKETNSDDPISHIYDNQAVIRMTVPIYSGGMAQSRVREGKMLLESARQEHDFYSQESRLKFEQFWEEQQFLIDQIGALDASEKTAQLYVEAMEKASIPGIKSIVDVLEAQAKLFEIRRDKVEAGYQLISNHLNLLALTGELNTESIAALEKALSK